MGRLELMKCFVESIVTEWPVLCYQRGVSVSTNRNVCVYRCVYIYKVDGKMCVPSKAKSKNDLAVAVFSILQGLEHSNDDLGIPA